MGLLKLWKKIKWARRIVALFSIISIVLTIYLWLFSSSVSAEIIDPKNIGIFGELKESSNRQVTTKGMQGILDTAEMIAKYMLDEKNKGNGFSYPHGSLKDEVPYNQLYNVGDSRWCVCATYVSWVLQDLGIWPEDRHEDGVSECWDWFEGDARFVRQVRSSEEKLVKGEILIYKSDGHSHINIYAGDGQYWDTGNDDGAMLGETKPHSFAGYTCSFTYEE